MTLLVQSDSGMCSFSIFCSSTNTDKLRPSISGLKKQWCPEIVELVEQMWAQEHQDRPTMTEVVETLEDLYSRY